MSRNQSKAAMGQLAKRVSNIRAAVSGLGERLQEAVADCLSQIESQLETIADDFTDDIRRKDDSEFREAVRSRLDALEAMIQTLTRAAESLLEISRKISGVEEEGEGQPC